MTPHIREIDGLYHHHAGCDCGECTTLAAGDEGNEQTVRFGQSFDTLVEQAIQNIYKKQGGTGMVEIDPALFALNNRPLQAAADRTFKTFGTEFGRRNGRFISQFKDNTAIFAAFKSHSEAATLSKLILDGNGNLRSFHEFRKVTEPVVGKYNKTWLQTEYNMTVRSARMGAQWQQFEEKKHIFPNLEYMRTSSLNPRAEHETFVGTILPVDDPWWDTHTPPLSWNCKCTLRQTRHDPTGPPANEEPVPPVFRNNPGKTAQAATDRHPYFPSGCASCPLPGERVIVNPELAAGQKKDCYHCLKAMKAAEVKTPEARISKKEFEALNPDKWKKDAFNKENGGYLATEHARIAQSKKSKNEAAKYNKEKEMCTTLANAGNRVKHVSDTDGGFDIYLNDVAAELKRLSGHNNIVSEAADAVKSKKAKLVIIEFDKEIKKIYTELSKLNKKKIHGKYWFKGRESKIYDF